MDVRRGTGKRVYPEVVFLFSLVTDDSVWASFDGWCTAQGVDHEQLRFDRWLNLVYYFAVRNASKEDKDKFDAAMADSTASWNLAKARPVLEAARARPKTAPTPDAGRVRKMPPRPAGWGDDRKATFDNKAAIKTLTAGGVSGANRRN